MYHIFCIQSSVGGHFACFGVSVVVYSAVMHVGVCVGFFFIFKLMATLFIYLFIFGCVGSSFRAWVFSRCGKRGPLSIAVRGPLTIAGPPVAGNRLQTRRLSSCGSRAQPLRGMRDLPTQGPKPVSPALAGRLATTAPPGKPRV